MSETPMGPADEDGYETIYDSSLNREQRIPLDDGEAVWHDADGEPVKRWRTDADFPTLW